MFPGKRYFSVCLSTWVEWLKRNAPPLKVVSAHAHPDGTLYRHPVQAVVAAVDGAQSIGGRAIATAAGASKDTVRRTIRNLEAAGVLEKIHLGLNALDLRAYLLHPAVICGTIID